MATLSTNWTQGAIPSGAASGTNTSPPDNSNSATISGNDFLTLLVTEMQNQDPTAATDPNEYINQLVNVNSLQQLISINQTLTTATGATSGIAHVSTSPSTVHSNAAHETGNSAHAARTPVHSAALAMTAVAGDQTLAARSISGNLSVPSTSPAAESAARALTRH